MINNYKAQRNVRAELGGAVNLGHPVSLYIKEDEVEYSSKNLATNGKFQDGTTAPFENNDMDEFGLATNPVSGRTSVRMVVGDANDIAFAQFNISVGKTYRFSFNRTIPNHDSNSQIKYRLGVSSGSGNEYVETTSFGSNTTTGVFRESFIFTAIATDFKFRVQESGSANDAEIYIDDVQLYEVVDHSYKLMAVNDSIPAQSVNTEALGSELITNGDYSVDSDPLWLTGTDGNGVEGWSISGGKATKSAPAANSGIEQSNIFENGKTYRVNFTISDRTQGSIAVYRGQGTQLIYSSGSSSMNDSHSIIITSTSTAHKILFNGTNNFDGSIDDVSVKEVYGYDYYNAPAYKFGIVSSVYDQSTGAMKTSGVAGDEVDVTVQGECNLIRPSGNNVSVVKDYVITKIGSTGNPTDSNPATEVDGGHQNIPNSVGVITETNSSSETAKAILWQGVEFSEHFVHKNSLQVMAKCDETITKFRPVSLFLDSNGDLLCRHDDIPEEGVDANTNYTGVDAGKWGVAELGGVSGELIPVTVAGKTTFKTDNSVPYRNPGDLITRLSEGGWLATTTNFASFAPNALGTVMEGGGAGDEVPITIFQGTPIGTITDWKRTIKVTAKAKGIVPQYRPVSLYLDENGNYRCTVDGIPRTSTDSNNGVWCDFRKWGISQEAVADSEDVEIIVQGRTRVKDASTNANRGEFVTKISSVGDVTSGDELGLALSTLGIIEKESKLSDGEPGVIIIF